MTVIHKTSKSGNFQKISMNELKEDSFGNQVAEITVENMTNSGKEVAKFRYIQYPTNVKNFHKNGNVSRFSIVASSETSLHLGKTTISIEKGARLRGSFSYKGDESIFAMSDVCIAWKNGETRSELTDYSERKKIENKEPKPDDEEDFVLMLLPYFLERPARWEVKE